MPLPSWPLIPKTMPEVRRLLAQRGLRALGDRPYDAVIHDLNLAVVDLEPLTLAIGPGWRMLRRRTLAHGRVVVDLLPPTRCPLDPPVAKPCEPQPKRISPQALLSTAAALAGAVGFRGRK